MAYSNDDLNDIYDRTDGTCHLCEKRLAFTNYGKPGKRAAWEIDHSRAKARGGTNRKNNLLPACISCNRSKGIRSTRSARAQNGLRRAPMSKSAREAAQRENAVVGAGLGAIAGSVLGPGGMVIGGFVGARVGSSIDPKR